MENLKNSKIIGFEVPFFQVDNNIFDKELGLNIYQKIIYIYLCRCSNQKNDAFPSYNTIAEKCGCSKRKAIDSVNDLIGFGLIKKRVRKNKKLKVNLSNVYLLKPISSHCLYGVADIKNNEGSAQHALGGSAQHALGSAQCAPKKELLKKNLEEDDETFSPEVNLFKEANTTISNLQKKTLKELVDTYSQDFVLKAIEVTSDKATKFNMSYVKQVLKSYSDKGFQTIKDIEDAENIDKLKKDTINRKREKNMSKQLETPTRKNQEQKGNFNNFEQRSYEDTGYAKFENL